MNPASYPQPVGASRNVEYNGTDFGWTEGTTTISAGATRTSTLIANPGFKNLAAVAQLSQAGTLTIQAFLDAAGTLPVWSISAPLVAATLLANPLNQLAPTIPFASWVMKITNSGASTATITKSHATLQP